MFGAVLCDVCQVEIVAWVGGGILSMGEGVDGVLKVLWGETGMRLAEPWFKALCLGTCLVITTGVAI